MSDQYKVEVEILNNPTTNKAYIKVSVDLNMEGYSELLKIVKQEAYAVIPKCNILTGAEFAEKYGSSYPDIEGKSMFWVDEFESIHGDQDLLATKLKELFRTDLSKLSIKYVEDKNIGS